ncbi:hypothetical protein RN001_009271 [Aquatica leii]|uniref:SNF-related serine/threonine-protein kinase n=1 Tax=Aquatica leii TaxID=1421715 RepID=A0AAN7SPV0_9COLE|nr:hypothetical protein RN001_009271 [Aquatica leii]
MILATTKILSKKFLGSFLNNFKVSNVSYTKSKCDDMLPERKITCKMDVACKVAVVNGGTSGIGLAAASQLLCAGARYVAITGDDMCKGKEAEKMLNSLYGSEKAIYINCNINCISQFEDAFRIAHSTFRKIDIVVNCVGVLDGSHWEREIVTNIIGTIRGTLLAYQFVGKEGLGNGGVVVNVAGIGGIDPVPPAPTLSAAEHAIVGLSKSFGNSIHTDKSGIRVVCFCPGFTATNFLKNLTSKGMTSLLGRELEILMNKSKKQGPDPCGHAVVHLIRHGDNGSVWVCEGAKLYCLKIPKRKAYMIVSCRILRPQKQASVRMHRSLGLGGGGSVAIRSTGGGVYDGKIAGLYDLEETLGRGHFAVVKLAKHVFTGEKVAVKVIDKSKLDDVSKAHLFQEVRCMKLVQHPNVVRLYEVIDTATKLYLILELGDGGDLYDYIMRHDAGLSEQVARDYFRQIVKAISYCHRLHVVHRDLKPENVVFFEKLGVVKLTDFGFSNKFFPGQKLETSCGSLAYSAPEILLGDSYDAPAVDVWSLGVILYMLVCGQAPFQEANDSETLTMIMDCKYTVPAHISKDCRDLIARMLVRDPEKRATLAQIAAHPWLAQNKDDQSVDIVPLITREQLSDDDHNLIVQKIVNGNIASKEEIQESIDKNAYNHITATYYLLAERKLKSKRQEQANKGRRPEHLAVVQGSPMPLRDLGNTGPTPTLLTVPRTPGDLPQRSRKCSIVQEDEEEEDLSSCSGREELAPPHNSLNRRGSRSEGRLNIALQERLSESERRKPDSVIVKRDVLPKVNILRNLNDDRPKSAESQNKWRMGKSASIPETTSPIQVKIISDIKLNADTVTTNIITEASTISIPVLQTTSYTAPVQKYKTMPSPTRTTVITPQLQLNEIFEEGDGADARALHRQFVSRNQKRTSYEQRRSKFHKNRTASCSSSDASDDDSESRKKRAHKLNNAEKPIIKGRRDSHDDSSDSQEPGTGAGAGTRNGRLGDATIITQNNVSTNQDSNKTNNTTSNNSTGRKNAGNCGIMIGRRHKAGRRRETRLRESQSLNRITEVQEDPAHSVIISTTLTSSHCANATPKAKGLGARILQGLNMSGTKKQEDKLAKEEKVPHLSRKDASLKNQDNSKTVEEKENCKLVEKVATKKMRLFGKYFQVHKKLYIPLPGIFSRNRLYKAQSCGSLVRDKISQNPDVIMRNRQRAASVIRNSIGSESDINQNMGIKQGKDRNTATVVHLNNACIELTGICATNLGQASKCCSFC